MEEQRCAEVAEVRAEGEENVGRVDAALREAEEQCRRAMEDADQVIFLLLFRVFIAVGFVAVLISRRLKFCFIDISFDRIQRQLFTALIIF